jgi:hypothetical protein
VLEHDDERDQRDPEDDPGLVFGLVEVARTCCYAYQLATRCSRRPIATASRREWALSARRMCRMWFRTVSVLR